VTQRVPGNLLRILETQHILRELRVRLAFLHDRPFFKLENKGTRMFFVLAFPKTVGGKNLCGGNASRCDGHRTIGFADGLLQNTEMNITQPTAGCV
jgi:hypothetical protein